MKTSFAIASTTCIGLAHGSRYGLLRVAVEESSSPQYLPSPQDATKASNAAFLLDEDQALTFRQLFGFSAGLSLSMHQSETAQLLSLSMLQAQSLPWQTAGLSMNAVPSSDADPLSRPPSSSSADGETISATVVEDPVSSSSRTTDDSNATPEDSLRGTPPTTRHGANNPTVSLGTAISAALGAATFVAVAAMVWTKQGNTVRRSLASASAVSVCSGLTQEEDGFFCGEHWL